MKAAVFGGSGFLGSHVADELSARGFEVVIYDKMPSPYFLEGQLMVEGDILDREKVIASVKGCEYVFSFAGVADIAEASRDPVKTIETNVLGTTIIAEACRLNEVRRLVFASTVYVYSDLAPFYRSSKQACELIIEDYQKNFGLNYTILRYGSLYGRRANHFNYIYKIIQQAIEEGRIVRKGDGEEIREYIHVEDAAKLTADVLAEEFRNQYVILTGPQSVKIKDLLYMIQEIFGGEITIEYTPSPDPGHYEITPYSFRPRVAKKMVAGSYLDLGQGILDVIYEVYLNLRENGRQLEHIERLLERE